MRCLAQAFCHGHEQLHHARCSAWIDDKPQTVAVCRGVGPSFARTIGLAPWNHAAGEDGCPSACDTAADQIQHSIHQGRTGGLHADRPMNTRLAPDLVGRPALSASVS